MLKKINKLIGLKKTDFDDFVSSGKISLSEPRLIPILKPGNEMALTSVLMSSRRSSGLISLMLRFRPSYNCFFIKPKSLVKNKTLFPGVRLIFSGGHASDIFSPHQRQKVGWYNRFGVRKISASRKS